MNLRNKLAFFIAVNSYVELITRGTSPLSLPDAVANSLQYVKAFGGTEQRNLPAEYTQLEHIQSDGASHLIIPYRVNNKTVFYCRYNEQSNGPGVANAVFGVTDTPDVSKANYGILRLTGGNFNRMGWGDSTPGSIIDVGAPKVFDTWYEILYDQNKLYQDGTLYATSATDPSTVWSANYGLGIFARNSSSATMSAIAKISSVWAKEDGEYKVNLVPAKRNSDNVLGMYDLVSGQFFTNAGTGDFVAGPEVVPTPNTPMDIVSNNGVLKASPNLFKSSDITTTTIYGVTISVDSDGVITADGTNSNPPYSQFVFPLSNPISEGTYTLSLYNSETSAGSLVGFAIGNTVGSRIATFTGVNSVRKITVNQGEVCNNVVIRIAGTVNQFKFKIQLEKGDQSTAYRPYNAVYADGVVETINIHSKNLFNKDATPYLSGQFINDTTTVGGNIITTTNGNYNVYRIPVSPSTTYTFGVIKASNPCWAVLDENGLVLQVGQHGAVTVDSITVTTDATAKYLCLSVAFQGGYKCDDILQLVKGSVLPTYEPYYDGGTAVAEMLLKVGDYQDVQSIIDGVVTRSVGVKVLDGTENWYYTATNKFSIYLADGRAEDNQGSAYCSHFAYVKSATFPTTDMYFSLNRSGAQCRFSLYYTAYTSADDFKQYLADQYAAGHPVIVIYPLATPTTESVAGQTLQVTDGDNIVEITQASLNGLELEAEYKKRK